MFCVSVGLKINATRGDQNVCSSTSWLSTRIAPTTSNFVARCVVDCTYAPISCTLSMSSLRPLIVPPVRGFVKM